MRIVRHILLVGAGLVVFVIAGGLAFLIIPFRPADSQSIHFERFVELPRKGVLNVLDYFTFNDRQLFVTNVTGGAVYKVDADRAERESSQFVSELDDVPNAHGVVFDPISHLAYVTSSGRNSVDVFDPSSMRLVKRISVPDEPDAIFYLPEDRLVYAATGAGQAAALIDPAAQAVTATIPLGGEAEFAAYDAQTKRLYQNLGSTNTVAVVDITAQNVAARWSLSGCELPTGMAFDQSNRLIFIACGKSAMLLVVSAESGRIIARIPVGLGPDTVAYDAQLRRLYTTGLGGTMTVIQQLSPGDYKVIDKIYLHFNAHTLVIDPMSHDVIVGYASLLTSPRLAIFSPRP